MLKRLLSAVLMFGSMQSFGAQELHKKFDQALEDRDFDTADALLKAGADINGTMNGEYSTFLYRYPSEPWISYLLSRGADINGTKNVHDETLLCYAARTLDKELAETLLQHGADVNEADEEGNTPLHLALQAEENEEWMFFGSLGREYEAHRKSRAARAAATEQKRTAFVRLLLMRCRTIKTADGRSVEFRNNVKAYYQHSAGYYKNVIEFDLAMWATMTPGQAGEFLVSAIRGHNFACADRALSKGADIRPFFSTDWCLDVKRLNYFLQRGMAINAPFEIQGKAYASLLLYAVIKGHEDIIRLLIQRGANCSYEDAYGFTLLDYLKAYGTVRCNSYKGDAEAIKGLLLSVGKNRSQEELDEEFMWNINHGFFDLADCSLLEGADIQTGFLRSQREAWYYLLSRGRNSDVQGKRSLMVSAIRTGERECMLWSLQQGADVTKRDEEGNTPLHEACGLFYGTRDAVLFLLTHCAIRKADGSIVDFRLEARRKLS